MDYALHARQYAEDIRQRALSAVRAAEYKLPAGLCPARQHCGVQGWVNENYDLELEEARRMWRKAINHARRDIKIAAERERNPTYCNQFRHGESPRPRTVVRFPRVSVEALPAAYLECGGDVKTKNGRKAKYPFAEPAIRFRIQLAANCEYNFHISMSKLRAKDLMWLAVGKDCKQWIYREHGGEFDPNIVFEVLSGNFIIRINFPDDGSFIAQKFELPHKTMVPCLRAAIGMLHKAGFAEES